jgi:hypothetical protein
MVGCASRGPVSEKVVLPPQAGPVCVLKAPLPVGIKYDNVGPLRRGKQWYGGTDEAIGMLADAARSKGADVLANVKAGHQIGFWAWARPVASGDALKLERPSDLDCKVAGGELR